MKLKLLSLLTILTFNLQAIEIICTGQVNQGELIELSFEYLQKENQIKMENASYPIQINNQFSIAWTNLVDENNFLHILSKINGSLQVIKNDQDGNQELRASMQCIDIRKSLFN